MLSESWLEGLGAMAAGGAAQKAANGETQSLTSFDMIVGREIGIAQKEHAGTNGSAIRFTELQGRTGEQAAELHFQQRKPRRKPGGAGPTAQRRGEVCTHPLGDASRRDGVG